MIIDSHQHFWNLKKVYYPYFGPFIGSINRDFEPAELEPQIKGLGVDKTILVQAMDSFEDTYYMMDIAEKFDWVCGIVGWVPLYKPDIAEKKIEEFIKNPKFKGIRHLIHEEKDPDWILREDVIEGLKVLAKFKIPFDVVAIFPNNLKHVPTIAEKVPDLKMVIDHLAKPPIDKNKFDSWATEMKHAAEYPQVYAKVSGLNTIISSNNWTGDDLKPFIEFAFDVFGAKRLMFGSDWPVLTLNGDYKKVFNELNTVLKTRTEEEISFVMGRTAAEFYNITTV